MPLLNASLRAIALSLLFSVCAIAQITFEGKVTGITDGDTFTLQSLNEPVKIRLQGIDAPEKDQPGGAQATAYLARLIFGKGVVASCYKRDQHDRYVCLGKRDGVDLSEAMLWAGHAWHFKRYENEQVNEVRERYAAIETFVRGNQLGLWENAYAEAPWEYRKESISVGSPARTSEPAVVTEAAVPTTGQIIGNRNSGIYHWPGCPNYADVSPSNRVGFATREEASSAGYRPAKNCLDLPAEEASTPAPASTTGTGGTVSVKGYYRKDGTYVRPHTRSAPRRRN